MNQDIKPRPGIVTAIGVLAIVFGSIGLFFSLFAIVMQLSGGNEYLMKSYKMFYSSDTADIFSSMTKVVEKYGFVILVSELVLLVIRLAQLAGGILLLKAKTAGYAILKIYAITCLVHLVVSIIWQTMYLNELTASIQGVSSAAGISSIQMMQSMMKVSMYAGIFIGILFGAAWPVIVLVLLTKKSVKSYIN
jgi:hypothetical protein